MSTGIKRPYVQGFHIGMKVLEGLAESCLWINLAGSLRRQKDMIGDIEIVAVPDGNKLYNLLDAKLAAGTIAHVAPKRWGQKMRSFMFADWQFDVFIQPDPATTAVNYMIRTGSALFSKQMVTPISKGGWMPDCYKVENARVWHDGKAVNTPDEESIFELWGMVYVAPKERTDNYKPSLFRHVRPMKAQQALIVLPEVPSPLDNPFIEGVTVKVVPVVVPASTQRGEWPIELPERFNEWVPPVSPDAGTSEARERRAKEARLAMGLKE